ncbi:hypothetical protein CEXT_315941 [Caerostris extrusa]|uniref:Uncharacterized protein n=1 Tax=Caerostris extrusa TaxID=172846 RepID=A0AAV4Q3K8_CAEEX|nr:hypothetical protein CEXT_315941 [Caerostris extrusa]
MSAFASCNYFSKREGHRIHRYSLAQVSHTRLNLWLELAWRDLRSSWRLFPVSMVSDRDAWPWMADRFRIRNVATAKLLISLQCKSSRRK